jgi:glutamate--cysteine ligase
MPCGLPPDENIPLGSYGSSNIGRAKSVYRMGLGHRYGRRMQTISGIHYNWSLPGLSNDEHFALIRNFRRHSLPAAVPVRRQPGGVRVLRGRPRRTICSRWSPAPLYRRTPPACAWAGWATRATRRPAGRQLQQPGGLRRLAARGADAPYPPYEAIGVRNLGGEYNQLATTLLQIENEFYGTIRPKRVIRPGERPLHALRERGVEYVEVRCMDLDPFEPVGINAATMRFLDVFLLHCLLADSPPDTPEEIAALGRNQHRTAARTAASPA